MHNTEILFDGYGQTIIEKTENYMIRMLKDRNLTRRRLQQSAHIGAEGFARAVDNLLKAEITEEVKEGAKKMLKLTDGDKMKIEAQKNNTSDFDFILTYCIIRCPYATRVFVNDAMIGDVIWHPWEIQLPQRKNLLTFK